MPKFGKLAEKWTTGRRANEKACDLDQRSGAMIAEISDILTGMTGCGHMLNQGFA
jgi:hypothetical protein